MEYIGPVQELYGTRWVYDEVMQDVPSIIILRSKCGMVRILAPLKHLRIVGYD